MGQSKYHCDGPSDNITPIWDRELQRKGRQQGLATRPENCEYHRFISLNLFLNQDTQDA